MRASFARVLASTDRPVRPLAPEMASVRWERELETQATILRTFIIGGIVISAAFGLSFVALGGIAAWVNLGASALSVAVLVVALLALYRKRPTVAAILALTGPLAAPVAFASVYSAHSGAAVLLLVMPLAAFALLPARPAYLRSGMSIFGVVLAAGVQLGFDSGWALEPLPADVLHDIAIANFVITALTMGMMALLVQRRQAVQDRLAERVFAHADRLAGTDHLTGLPNRRPIMAHLERELAAGRRVVVALADLDNFKAFNDTYGHHCGDEVLMSIARRLAEGVRGDDMVARWGGEEFLIVLSDLEQHQAVRVLDRLRFGVEQRVTRCAGHGHSVTVTMGAARCDGPADLDDALRRADAALYAAKRAGRNRIIHAA